MYHGRVKRKAPITSNESSRNVTMRLLPMMLPSDEAEVLKLLFFEPLAAPSLAVSLFKLLFD